MSAALSTLGIARESFHGAIAQLPHVPTPQAQARTGAGYYDPQHTSNTPLSPTLVLYFARYFCGFKLAVLNPRKILIAPQLRNCRTSRRAWHRKVSWPQGCEMPKGKGLQESTCVAAPILASHSPCARLWSNLCGEDILTFFVHWSRCQQPF